MNRIAGLGSIAALAQVWLSFGGAAVAQASDPAWAADSGTVSWTVPPPATVKRGGRAAIVIQGAVREGWHVYGLKQAEGGPTPLRVALEPSDFATPAGPPAGSPSTTVFEPAFGLKTPYYTRNFTVTVPVRFSPGAPAGRQLIPVSVRFQTCNGQTCEPPKTVRLSVPVVVDTEA